MKPEPAKKESGAVEIKKVTKPSEKKSSGIPPAKQKAEIPKKEDAATKQNPDDIPMEVVKPKEDKKDKDRSDPSGQFTLEW